MAQNVSQKSRVAANDHARATGLLRNHIAGDAANRPAHVREREFLADHRTPSRCAKLDGCHDSAPNLKLDY